MKQLYGASITIPLPLGLYVVDASPVNDNFEDLIDQEDYYTMERNKGLWI